MIRGGNITDKTLDILGSKGTRVKEQRQIISEAVFVLKINEKYIPKYFAKVGLIGRVLNRLKLFLSFMKERMVLKAPTSL